MRGFAPLLSAASFGVAIMSIAHPAMAQPGPPGPQAQDVADPTCSSLSAPGLIAGMTVTSATGKVPAGGGAA